ncbi:MAG TPA: ADOP family duplicated permease [Acidobacteriota bacterium]|nr:ADOP family duplicated permease [Acidobacteriota bacterium]
MNFRHRLRSLLRRPGLAAATVAMLAIGIGASTAIYSVVYHLVLQPLPVEDPHDLVRIMKTREGMGFWMALDAEDVRAISQATQIVSMLEFTSEEFVSLSGDHPQNVLASLVSDNFFSFTGTVPQLGRPFESADWTSAGRPPVILSHQMWSSRFGQSEGVLGQVLELDGNDYEIVGVMPFGFGFPFTNVDVWTPLDYESGQAPKYLNVLGRLAPGVGKEQAQAEIDGILAGLSGQEKPWTSRMMTLSEMLGKRTEQALWLLLAAVGLVLLIACANAANLIFVHGNSRAGQTAVQQALGAGRGRLIRGILGESLALSVAGGTGGLLLAFWGLDLIRALRPENLSELASVRLDGPILAFCLLLSLGSGLVAGLIPALKLSRADFTGLLRTRSSRHFSAGDLTARRLLVVVEMALCTVLLVGAGLLIRSFDQVSSTDPGYRAEGLLAARLTLPKDRYPEQRQREIFFSELRQRCAALPGVSEAAVGLTLPSQMGVTGGSLQIQGREALESAPSFAITTAGPDYFRVTGVPLLAGRTFASVSEEDVVIVNQAVQRRYFPEDGAVGQKIRLGQDQTWATIIGVAGDVRAFGLRSGDDPVQLYFPLGQFSLTSATLIARSGQDLTALAESIPGLVTSLDPRLPVQNISTARQTLSGSIARERFSTVLFALFAAAGVALAAIGLYGMLSFLVQERRREFGIRMALGAPRRRILTAVLRGSLLLGGIGLALGLLGSYWFNRLLASQLGAISANDPAALVGAALLLAAITVAASLVPAARATRIDPGTALRTD